MSKNLLIVEDDHTMRETLGDVFRKKNINVFESMDGAKGLDIVKNQVIQVLLLDLNLPDMSGLEFWLKAKNIDEEILCIFMTAYPEVKTAVTAMREGAFDYINKPFELEEMYLLVDKAFKVRNLKSEVLSLKYERDYYRKSLGMVGNSDAIKVVQDHVYQVAQSASTPVLILGESGTGKELVAEAIHNLSLRKENPMLTVNCSAIPDNLLESELFGYEKGAFTDAKTSKAGIFELSHTGTIFLDEIGDMNLTLQPKLLRVLESKSFRRVGGIKDIIIDTRVISATNQNIHEKIENGSFRSDLLYRLNVITIHLPPLRERISDIPMLANHFLTNIQLSLNKEIDGFEDEAIEHMKKYSWPGNIRELKNAIERACILTKSNKITLQDCMVDTSHSNHDSFQKKPIFTLFNTWIPLEEVEFRYIQNMLEHCGGNKSEAARQLGISRVTLREKLKKYSSSQPNLTV